MVAYRQMWQISIIVYWGKNVTRCEGKHNSSHFLKKYLCSEYQKYSMILACWIRKGIINCDSRDLIVLMGQEQKIKILLDADI